MVERYGSSADAEVAHAALLTRRSRRGYSLAREDELPTLRRLMARRRAALRAPAQLAFAAGHGF